MTTNKKKLLLADSLGKEAREMLAAREDVTPIYFPHLLPNDDFLELVRKEAPVSAWALGATRISHPHIDAAKALEVTARIGVGYDAIDIPAHNEHGVPLMTAGIANSPSVAEHAIFMMLWLARKSSELDGIVRGEKWLSRMSAVPFDLFEKNVLIIGFGRIGTRTAKRCLAMDMRVLVYDPYVAPEDIRAAGCEPVASLDDALAEADFVSIHCPKTPETVGMFDADRLARMKSTAYLVNTARGGIIDEDALYKALTEGTIAGAGLDVFAKEPVDPANPLLKCENLITSPHMAGVTREAIDRMSVAAVKNILSVFDGAPMVENVINKEVLEK